MSRCFLVLLLLAACTDPARPFQGAPGAAAMRLAQPPPARIAVVSDSGASGAYVHAVAVALQEQEMPAVAEMARQGDWRLRLDTQASGGTTTPTFTLIDPAGKEQGSEQGRPIPSDVWRQGQLDTLKRSADEAAPRIVTLLARVEAVRRQSDPRSLTNRPGRAAVTEVTGAPGDGNIVLLRLMREKLSERGQVVQESTAGVDFTIKAIVTETPVNTKTRRIEIIWLVHSARGDEIGKIVQANEIPAGTLDRHWGDIGVVVTEEAATAIRDMISNQSNRR